MDKKQLANKIWEAANNLRSKIEASEYKDYILGFIFYKFLSDNEVRFLKENSLSEEKIKLVEEIDSEANYCKNRKHYFIPGKHLFSSWVDKGTSLKIGDVTEALNAFDRLIKGSNYESLFSSIFDSLRNGLMKLGSQDAERSKAAADLIHLVNDIPTSEKDYDVLGFIYEYLISKFAANAGKKAGEFYTPHEVSYLISEIIAEHLKDRKTIQIYDSTSGSGSLLINIGKTAAKYIDPKNIEYYAQELKQNTYNLTRMNLIMRGINPVSIKTRCADTLKDDWPMFEEGNRENTYKLLPVDAVISNPPYSQHWDLPTEEDPRFNGFGLAPKGKADYAFLLHDLYHLKPNGIGGIILPHGVLFRGGTEYDIRKQLVEQGNIHTIIGLPPNIFFGTSIPTIIIILRKNSGSSGTDGVDKDILFVDASKGFEKVGNKNVLRACDIRRIADTVISRSEVEKYSRRVPITEIRENDYNLNITRYVDSNEEEESWDIYAAMFGGIPEAEIDQLEKYWNVFPNLRNDIFKSVNKDYAKMKQIDLESVLESHTADFIAKFKRAVSPVINTIKNDIANQIKQVDIPKKEPELRELLFKQLKKIPLVDQYDAYQHLAVQWDEIATDLEILQREGFDAGRALDENDNEYKGRIIPFNLVQDLSLKKEADSIRNKETRRNDIAEEYKIIIESLSDEDKETSIIDGDDDNPKFNLNEVKAKLDEICRDSETDEIRLLGEYNGLSNKNEKNAFTVVHSELSWSRMTQSKNGTFTKTEVNNLIKALYSELSFGDDSLGAKLRSVIELDEEEKEIKKQLKIECEKLQEETINIIEALTDDEIVSLLEKKWTLTLTEKLNELPVSVVNTLKTKIEHLAEKYAVKLTDVEKGIKESESQLVELLGELCGNKNDMKGIEELRIMLGGDE